MEMTARDFVMNFKMNHPEFDSIPDDKLLTAVLQADPSMKEQIIEFKQGPAASPAAPHDEVGERLAQFPGTPQAVADFAGGAVTGAKRAGIGVAEMVTRLGNELRTGDGGRMWPYDPAAFREQRSELPQATSVPGAAGQMAGESLPTIPTLMVAPQGLLGRFATDVATGAVQGEIMNPGKGAEGALLGGIGSAVGQAASSRTGLGRKIASRQDRLADRELLRVLSPGTDPVAVEQAQKAVPYLRSEGVLSGNPVKNTTGGLKKRTTARKGYREGRLQAEYDAAEAAGSRLDLEPAKADLLKKQQKMEVPGTQVPPGTKLKVTLADLLDANGQPDRTLMVAYGITADQLDNLRWGAARGGVDEVLVPINPTVVRAAKTRHLAMGRELDDLTRVEIETRASEAAQTGVSPRSVPPGVPVKAARGIRQELEEGKYKGVTPTVSSAAGKKAESAAAGSVREQLNTQFPRIAAENEPFHHLANIEKLLEDKAKRQESGTAGERYALIRGLASLIRTASAGSIALPAASATVSSSAYHALNAQVRTLIARQIQTGNLEAAARTLSRLGEGMLQEEDLGDNRRKNISQLQQLGVRVNR